MGREKYRGLIVGLVLALLAGCAAVKDIPYRDKLPEIPYFNEKAVKAFPCRAFYSNLEKAKRDAKLHSMLGFVVNEYPFVRPSRFMASYVPALDTHETVATWFETTMQWDLAARQMEHAALPDDVKAKYKLADWSATEQRIKLCQQEIVEWLDADSRRIPKVVYAVKPPEHYSEWKRQLGIYSATKLAFQLGVDRWQEEASSTFNRYQNTYPYQNYLFKGQQFEPVKFNEFNELGMPLFSTEQWKALFAQHAPVWELETASESDVLVALELSKGGVVARPSPKVYTYLGYAHSSLGVLTQLNYVVWFPARPREKGFDIYAGYLDGINWRVTLDPTGRVVAYDTIHNCGCYHNFYLNDGQDIRVPEGLEFPLVHHVSYPSNPDLKPIITVSHSKHHVVGLRFAEPEPLVAKGYRMRAYESLYQLNENGQVASAFNEDGIIAGSSRLERFILWPSGVQNPGAMRMKGTHVTAFIGERYFDDPYLHSHLLGL